MKTRRFILGGLAAAGATILNPAAARLRSPAGGVGTGGGGIVPTTINGSIAPQVLNFSGSGMVVQITGPTNGTMSFRGFGFFNSGITDGNLTFQWYIDNNPIGPQMTTTVVGGGGPMFATTYNTALLTNGNHVIWGRFIDADTNSLNGVHVFSLYFIVDNPPGTFSIVSQTVPASQAATFTPLSWGSDPPDFITYGGNPGPVPGATPMPHLSVAGSNSATLRDNIGAFWGQSYAGPRIQEYSRSPFWATQWDGGPTYNPTGVTTFGSNVEDAQATADAYQQQLFIPYQDGAWGDAWISPFSTFVEAPDGSKWFFVEINGRFAILDYTDGSVTTVAGKRRDKSKFVYNQGLAPNETLANSTKEVVGTFVGGVDLGGVQDFCFDPNNNNIIYLCSIIDNVILKIDMTGWPGTPATVSPFAGDGSTGSTNGAALLASFNSPSAMCIDSGGNNIYIADQQNCLIRKLTVTAPGVAGIVSNVVGVLGVPTPTQANTSPLTYSPESTVHFADPAYIVNPAGLRFNSAGKLIVYELYSYNFRSIDLVAGTIDWLGAYAFGTDRGNGGVPYGWGQIDVDTMGMVGPVDDVIGAIPGDGEDVGFRVSSASPGSYHNYLGFGPGYPNYTVSGLGGQTPKGGHYNWTIAISKFRGEFLVSGLQSPGVLIYRLANGNDPSITNTEVYTLNSGANIYWSGTCTCRGAKTTPFAWAGGGSSTNTWPWNLRPPFVGLRGDIGYGGLNVFPGANNFAEMSATYTTDAALGAYIQSGMGGSVPRPEITGNDLRDLIFYIRRNTPVGANYPNVVSPAADDADTGNFPTITLISAVRNSPTSITVTWTTNKPTIGFAMAGSAAMQSRNQPYPCFSPVETMTVPYGSDGPTGGGLNHTATITTLPSGVTPIHYSVQVRDMAGNPAYTGDLTIA